MPGGEAVNTPTGPASAPAPAALAPQPDAAVSPVPAAVPAASTPAGNSAAALADGDWETDSDIIDPSTVEDGFTSNEDFADFSRQFINQYQ